MKDFLILPTDIFYMGLIITCHGHLPENHSYMLLDKWLTQEI